MNLKLIVILFVIFLTGCNCGLLNWFNRWTDDLYPKNAETKFRETRKAEENGIKPDITDSTADKTVSLMDIKEGELTAQSGQTGTRQGNLKTKSYRVSAYNPVVGAVRRSPKLLPLVKRDSTPEERCTACTNRPTCKLLKQCKQCNEDCKGIAIYTDDLLRPWTNQSVGMANRMTPPNTNDLSSKKRYPMATYRDGGTKDIICRIIGITDASDIDTVTIWVTTHSNTPPKILQSMTDETPKKVQTTFDHNLGKSGTKHTNYNEKAGIISPSSSKTSPDIRARFNDYDDENGDTISRLKNNGMEKLKTNPDLIEGPPPFVGSSKLPSVELSPNNENRNNLRSGGISQDKAGIFNKPIVVQPKEYLSEDSDEDDTDDDTISPSSPSPLLPPSKEATTTANIKPRLLSKLRELASSRANRISDLIDRRQKIENSPSTRERFSGNLLKSRQNTEEINSKIQNPATVQDVAENTDQIIPNENRDPSIKLPGESDDQIAKINEAIQEVKSMVKNMQDEASKASEKRLLGASHTADTDENSAQNNIASQIMPSLPTNQMPQILSSHVADNLKKVNQFFINRAQDALDMIGPKQKTNPLLRPTEVDNIEAKQSDITKDTIKNLKQMPQFLLDRAKDTMSGFENKPLGNPSIDIDNNDIEDHGNKINRGENVVVSNNEGSSAGADDDDRNETIVGQPEQGLLENENIPNIETKSNVDSPTTKTYKNKLEKYFAELKEKRQKMYSPEKNLESASPKASKVASLSTKIEEPVKSIETIQNVIPNKEEIQNNYGKDKTSASNILTSSNDLENQRDLLRKKLKNFIDGVKSKATSNPSTTKIEEIIPSGATQENGLVIKDNQGQNSYSKPIVEPLDRDLPQAAFEDLPATIEVPRTSPQNLPQDMPTDQIVGESKPNNDEINDIHQFIPTIPALPSNKIYQNTEPANKLQKYLEELKAKQSFLFKPKSDNSEIINRNTILESNNEPEDKKDLLKSKIKSYVDKLKKPVDEKVGQPEMSLDQRMSDQISNFNNKLEDDMKNYLGATPDMFKKDLLKEKLRNYVASLRKPMGSRMVPEFVRKASETQREELNSLKKKLEGLLKAREPTPSLNMEENPLVSKAAPSLKPSMSKMPIISDAKPMNEQNNNIVGDTRHPTLHYRFGQNSDEASINSRTMGNQDLNLQEGGDNLDWSHSLGKIVQSSTQPKEIFFLGSGIKLPLKLTEGPNGMDLSVDLEKLCSCYNATSCPKNHTAIEETVGAILEKEAELNEQLKGDTLDDVKIEPVLGSPPVAKPMSENTANVDKKPTILQKFLGNIKAETMQKRKSNIFKRSSDVRELSSELTTLKTVLENLQKENEGNSNNNVLKESDLPLLPSLDVVTDELTNLGQKVQNSVTNSVKQITNNVEEIKKEIGDTSVIPIPNLFLNPKMPIIPSFNEIKEQAEEITNNMLEKLEHTNNLNNLLKANGLRTSSGVDVINNLMPIENPLSAIKNQVNEVIKNFEKLKTMNKITQKTGLNRLRLPKTSITKDPSIAFINDFQEILKKSIPTAIPELQNRINEMNDDVVKIADAYQFGKTNILEKKLEQLDDEVQEYYKKNEKLLSGESKKLFGGHNDELIAKEVNIINRIISWIRSLASGIKI